MPTRNPVKPAQSNQSIESAIACLLELTNGSEPIGCNDMAERLQVERTKASRILGTLAHLGMVQRLPDLRYIPGPGIHLLSTMAFRASGLLSSALPHIKRMRETRGTRAALGVVWRTEVGYVYHNTMDQGPNEAIGGHDHFPAHLSCIGRVILATHDDSEIRDRFGDSLSAAEYETLFASIKTIREEGMLIEQDEIAMAIGDPVVGGIAFFTPTPNTHDTTLIAEVADIVADISKAITSTTTQTSKEQN